MGQRLERLEAKLQSCMIRANQGHHLLALCTLLSFIGTLTAAYPVSAIIITAVLMVPRHWVRLSIASSIGSTVAGTMIVGLAHFLGYDEIHAWFPSLINNDAWNEASVWINRYGIWAIFVIGASPLPQMPLLIFFGIIDDRLFDPFLALLGGKIFKYCLLAWITRHFPEKLHFFQRLHSKIPARATD